MGQKLIVVKNSFQFARFDIIKNFNDWTWAEYRNSSLVISRVLEPFVAFR